MIPSPTSNCYITKPNSPFEIFHFTSLCEIRLLFFSLNSNNISQTSNEIVLLGLLVWSRLFWLMLISTEIKAKIFTLEEALFFQIEVNSEKLWILNHNLKNVKKKIILRHSNSKLHVLLSRKLEARKETRISKDKLKALSLTFSIFYNSIFGKDSR